MSRQNACTEISVVILAGGKSTRFGRDKTTVRLDGETLLERAVRRLSPIAKEAIVVRGQGQPSAGIPGVLEVEDIYPGKGPLGGIYSGLLAASSFHSLAVACDMPFLDLRLIDYMCSLAPGYDVVMPKLGQNTEALHSIYSKDCIPHIEALVLRDRVRVIEFLNAVKVRFVRDEEVDRYDPERLSFFNINTEADLKRARELVQRGCG